MNRKAIKIDLSTFFDDERRLTCVLVDPNWKSVACLQKRVEFLFDVDSVRFLSDGYFLPPQESIEIMKFCNDLKAFVPKESLEKRKKKKSQKCKSIEKSSEESGHEETVPAKADTQIKRKYNPLAISNPSCTLSNKAKRSKNYNTFSEITSTSEPIAPPTQVLDEEVKTKKSKPKKSKVSIATSENEEPMVEIESCGSKSKITVTGNSSNVNENTTDNNKADDNQHKQRLTSTPKDRKTSEFKENRVEKSLSDEKGATTTRYSSIPSSTFLNESKLQEERNNVNTLTCSPNPNNPFKNPKSSEAHIYFNESGEMVRPTAKKTAKSALKKDKEPKTIVIFRCPLSEVSSGIQTQKPRIFNLKSTNIGDDKTEKHVVEIQEQIILSHITQEIDPKSSSKEQTVTNEIERQQPTIEKTEIAEETDSLNEKRSLNNSSNVTDSTTIANNVDKSSNETTNVTASQVESQVKETTIMSVHCVDLSIDIDDEDNEEHTIKTTPTELKVIAQEKLDLTADDEVNDLSSDVEEISEIIDLNETEDNCDATVNTVNDENIDNILPFSTDLIDLPKAGDKVIFKISFTNQKQQYVQTNYMAGNVEYVHRRTKSMKILITDGDTELSKLPRKFICNLDDYLDNKKYVQLKLNEMVEPKLFSRA